MYALQPLLLTFILTGILPIEILNLLYKGVLAIKKFHMKEQTDRKLHQT